MSMGLMIPHNPQHNWDLEVGNVLVQICEPDKSKCLVWRSQHNMLGSLKIFPYKYHLDMSGFIDIFELCPHYTFLQSDKENEN